MKIDSQLIFNIFSFVALFATGVIFVFSQIRRNDLQTLRIANTDLRDSIQDKSKRIDELSIKLDILSKKVTLLENQNTDLQAIVKEALITYFIRYPQVATDLNK